MAQKLFSFEIFVNGEKVDEVQLEATGSIKIGSHERVDLHVKDPNVSRVHALVELGTDGQPSVVDLGSGRGTFVNGQRVNKEVLKNGDVIQVGETQLRFKYYSPRAAGRGAAAPVEVVPTSVTYSRRFLSRPARTDGTIEVAAVWRDVVLADEHYKPAEDVVIGPDSSEWKSAKKGPKRKKDVNGPGFLLAIDDPLITEPFVLIEAREGKDSLLRVLDGMEGEIFIGSDRYHVRELIAAGVAKPSGKGFAVPLTGETRARIDFGKVSVFVHQSVSKPAVFPYKPNPRGAMISLIALLIAFLVHVIPLLIAAWMPPDYSMGTSDDFMLNERFVQLLITEEVPPEEAVPEWLQQDDSEDDVADEGAIVAGEAGRAGDERAEDTGMRGTIGSTQGSGDVSELARGAARDEALQTGALAALNSYAGGSVFGTGAGSYTDVVAIGGADGMAIGSSYGTGGLGAYGGGLSTGSAVGGGGGFGIGPMALRGRSGSNTANRGLRDISDRQERQVAVTPGRPEVEGQLDREIIERVIRQHRREIRACYEQELQRNASLEGRVVVSFVIDPSGQVARASIGSSTMGNSTVEDCITLRVRRWRFPEPSGGGLVRVNYPFTFVAGG